MEASGQGGEACWWRAAWERAGLARLAVEMPIEKVMRPTDLSFASLRLLILGAANTEISGASLGSSLLAYYSYLMT